MVPNPARDRAEVRVFLQESGEVTVSIWSLLGKPLAELPSIVADGAGSYVVEVDLRGVKTGTYLLRAKSGSQTSTAHFTVVR
ncbi:MAG: T9SS type A sorting domain-containing protein [Chlorobi bacterium]|nr:T9SS type A sorting domain-containing protein [Chlorobiota bacterium]